VDQGAPAWWNRVVVVAEDALDVLGGHGVVGDGDRAAVVGEAVDADGGAEEEERDEGAEQGDSESVHAPLRLLAAARLQPPCPLRVSTRSLDRWKCGSVGKRLFGGAVCSKSAARELRGERRI
jgi:hypothetical protein